MASEDFTTYTEVDAAGDITKTATRVTWTTMDRNAESYVYKDKGVGYFSGDFRILLTLRIVSSTQGAGNTASPLLLANNLDDLRPFIFLGTHDCICLAFEDGAGEPTVNLELVEVSGGTKYAGDTDFVLGVGSTYYLKLDRKESVGTYGAVYCYIYSDSARTNLLCTMTLTLHSKQDLRYLYPLCNYNTGATGYAHSGYVENVIIVPSYPSDDIARVSSIRHIFRPGMFRMQVGLGDLGLDIDVAEATVRKELDTAKEVEEAPPTEPLYVGPGERGEPARPTRAEPITPFDFRTPEDIGVSAKVTGPEPTPSPISQEAVRQTPSLAQKLTPWREEEGETPLTELAKGYRLLREWFGGLFK